MCDARFPGKERKRNEPASLGNQLAVVNQVGLRSRERLHVQFRSVLGWIAAGLVVVRAQGMVVSRSLLSLLVRSLPVLFLFPGPEEVAPVGVGAHRWQGVAVYYHPHAVCPAALWSNLTPRHSWGSLMLCYGRTVFKATPCESLGEILYLPIGDRA